MAPFLVLKEIVLPRKALGVTLAGGIGATIGF
jgi:hypothetical protein